MSEKPISNTLQNTYHMDNYVYRKFFRAKLQSTLVPSKHASTNITCALKNGQKKNPKKIMESLDPTEHKNGW